MSRQNSGGSFDVECQFEVAFAAVDLFDRGIFHAGNSAHVDIVVHQAAGLQVGIGFGCCLRRRVRTRS